MDKRGIFSVFAGLLGAGVLVWLAMSITHQIYPVDKEMIKEAIKSRESFETYMLSLPTGTFIGVILGHGFGILGGVVIGRLIDSRTRTPMFVIAVIMLLMSLLNYLSLPHPGWFLPFDLGFTIVLVSAYIFSRKKA